MRERFRKYLIDAGYKETTPSGRQSTVYDYLKRIDRVCKCENTTWEALADSIGQIVTMYDVGGPKEELGKASHSAVINALRRYQEFVRTR